MTDLEETYEWLASCFKTPGYVDKLLGKVQEKNQRAYELIKSFEGSPVFDDDEKKTALGLNLSTLAIIYDLPNAPHGIIHDLLENFRNDSQYTHMEKAAALGLSKRIFSKDM